MDNNYKLVPTYRYDTIPDSDRVIQRFDSAEKAPQPNNISKKVLEILCRDGMTGLWSAPDAVINRVYVAMKECWAMYHEEMSKSQGPKLHGVYLYRPELCSGAYAERMETTSFHQRIAKDGSILESLVTIGISADAVQYGTDVLKVTIIQGLAHLLEGNPDFTQAWSDRVAAMLSGYDSGDEITGTHQDGKEAATAPKVNELTLLQRHRLMVRGVKALYTPTEEERKRVQAMLDRVWGLFPDEIAKDNHPPITATFLYDAGACEGDFANSGGMYSTWYGKEEFSIIGIERGYLSEDADAIAFIILHEICHAFVPVEQGKDHNPEYHKELDRLIQVYNDKFHASVENDYFGLAQD